jgi:nicotinate-nucleotide adenylyltransferase
LDFDEVWLTPCYQHTFLKHLAPIEDRVVMTKMIMYEKVKFSDEEILNKLSGDSIDLLDILTKKYPEDHFSFVIGTDNLYGFKRWGRWEKLITTHDFILFPRPGFTENLADYQLDNPEYKFHLLEHPLLVTSDISSTKIRERIQRGISIKHLVPDEVGSYILKQKLYR